MRQMLGLLIAGLALADRAQAQEDRDLVTPYSGDLALVLGRNFDQGATLGGLVGELKVNVHPQVAIGGRLGGTIGGGLGLGGVDAYLGFPVLAKGEAFLGTERSRPFIGLGAGLTILTAAGVGPSVRDAAAVAYGAYGAIPTIMPELGVDLGALRLSVSHSALVGTTRGIAAALGLSGVDVDRERIPDLSATTLQIGVHLGGVRRR